MYSQVFRRACLPRPSHRHNPPRPPSRTIHCSSPCPTLPTLSLSGSFVDTPGPSSSSQPSSLPNARHVIYQRKLSELMDALSSQGSRSRAWAYYVNLMQFLGRQDLPIEVHREVLRGCTPPHAALRAAAMRRIATRSKPLDPRVYEGRFQTIIRNMRSIGATPTLDDYNYILAQFAALGYYSGSMHVYKEMVHLGVQPRTKTFGLCLQSIARRLSLPCRIANRPHLILQTKKVLVELLKDMQIYDIPFTSTNFDLALRILKETLDCKGFETLVRVGYGIDLSHPDRASLSSSSSTDVASVLENNAPHLSPIHFSTSSLNTILDMLGRLGNVSRLIQSFEVLTQPLPPQAGQHLASTFDDDDDFGVSMFPPHSPFRTPPCAEPNTTSYNILLKHVSRLRKLHLTRHYLLQAMYLDRIVDRKLRGELLLKPMEEVLAPQFSINRTMLVSVFGASNRNKSLELMKWLNFKIPRILRRKRNDIAHYSAMAEKLTLAVSNKSVSTDGTSSNTVHLPTSSPATPDHTPTTSSPSPGFSSAEPTSSSQSNASLWFPAQTFPELNLSVEDTSPPSPPAVKYFDLGLHLCILHRDIEQITAYQKHVQKILERTEQRIKERNGRRIWNGRDVYIRSLNRRVHVMKERWQDMVNFKAIPESSAPPRTAQRNTIASSKSGIPSHLVHRPTSTVDKMRTISTSSRVGAAAALSFPSLPPLMWQNIAGRGRTPGLRPSLDRDIFASC